MGMSIGGGKAKVQPDMNVTPLVDVVLVLLIIFMVLSPVVSEAFYVRLPPKDDTDQRLDAANDPKKPLVLSVHEDGSVHVNAVDLGRDELASRLRRMFNARPDNVLYLDAHDAVAYRHVISAIDLARAGSASPVVVITKKLE